MENEINENIQEVISLASKCYSLKLKNDQRKKVKGIQKIIVNSFIIMKFSKRRCIINQT